VHGIALVPARAWWSRCSAQRISGGPPCVLIRTRCVRCGLRALLRLHLAAWHRQSSGDGRREMVGGGTISAVGLQSQRPQCAAPPPPASPVRLQLQLASDGAARGAWDDDGLPQQAAQLEPVVVRWVRGEYRAGHGAPAPCVSYGAAPSSCATSPSCSNHAIKSRERWHRPLSRS